MDAERQREIARKGGRAAHEKGKAHEFTTDEARSAADAATASVEMAARTSLAIIEAGDSLGSQVEQANSTVSSVASSISDGALITTLAVGDSAITASIKTGFIRDPDLNALKIDIETRNGVVSLNGLACNEEGRERAESIARATKNVVRVNNYLAIKRI